MKILYVINVNEMCDVNVLGNFWCGLVLLRDWFIAFNLKERLKSPSSDLGVKNETGNGYFWNNCIVD